jgi:hypothetical protein
MVEWEGGNPKRVCVRWIRAQLISLFLYRQNRKCIAPSLRKMMMMMTTSLVIVKGVFWFNVKVMDGRKGSET